MNIFQIFIYVYIILSVWYVISAVHINRNNLYQKNNIIKMCFTLYKVCNSYTIQTVFN